MNPIITIIIAIAIIYSGYKLLKEFKAQRKKLDALKRDIDDLNIEFSANTESGICQTRKQYPEMEVKDNHRTGTSNTTEGHSIAKGMNDPSQTQKEAFKKAE